MTVYVVLVIVTLFGLFSTPSSSPSSTPTPTSTTAAASSTVCNACSAINGAVSLPTPIFQQQNKRDDGDRISELTELSSRSLEKRAGRLFTPAKIGAYGLSFGNTQPSIDLCPSNLFTWHALKYLSTSSLPNQAPQAAVGGEENTDDGDDDATLVTSISAPDVPGIGVVGDGPFVDIQYQYSILQSNDNSGLEVTICGYQIAGFPDRFASTNDFFYRIATGKQPEQNYYDSELSPSITSDGSDTIY